MHAERTERVATMRGCPCRRLVRVCGSNRVRNRLYLDLPTSVTTLPESALEALIERPGGRGHRAKSDSGGLPWTAPRVTGGEAGPRSLATRRRTPAGGRARHLRHGPDRESTT